MLSLTLQKGGKTDMRSKGLVFGAAAFVLLFAQIGVAQEDVSKYPSKPINYICPAPPGAGGDLSSRLMAKELEKILGQPVVVVSKPGGAFVIGTAAIAASKPDGYTIGYTGGPPVFYTPLLEKVPYHPVKDLRWVAQYGAPNSALAVKGDSSFKTFKDLINYARQNPKKVAYGTPGTNSISHIMMELIAKQEKVQFTHIPYKGAPEAQAAVLGGHIMIAIGDMGVSLVESGQLRLLMMLMDEKSAEYPNVPTLKDLGYDIPYPMNFAIIAPKAVPDAIIKKLDDAVAKVMKEPSFLKGMQEFRFPVAYRSGKELDVSMAKNYEYFKSVFTEMGLIK